jgi:lipoate-protein ligase A
MSLELFPLWSQDEDLVAATAADGRPRVRVARPARAEIVLGRGSREDLELALDAVRADGAPVSRRRGGGCAVVLDPGNVVVSLALPAPGIGDNPRWFRRITDWLVAALARLGHDGLRQEGVSDLAQGDRKVGGSALYRSKGLLYYSTTLLAAPDTAAMERWLAHPPREPAWRRGRAHRDFVGALAPAAGPEELAAALRATLDPAAIPE